MKEYFEGIGKIQFEGPESTNPLVSVSGFDIDRLLKSNDFIYPITASEILGHLFTEDMLEYIYEIRRKHIKLVRINDQIHPYNPIDNFQFLSLLFSTRNVPCDVAPS